MPNVKTYNNVNEILYEKLSGKINWQNIAASKLSNEIIITFQNELLRHWQYLTQHNYIAPNLIQNHIQHISLGTLLMKTPFDYNCYDLEFVLTSRTAAQKALIRKRKIEDDLLMRYQNSIMWPEISEYQNLTKSQLIKYARYLKWPRLIKNRFINMEMLFELKKTLPFKNK